MMLAAGPYALPWIREAMDAGWQGEFVGAPYIAPLAATYFNMRKTTIYGGSQRGAADDRCADGARLT